MYFPESLKKVSALSRHRLIAPIKINQAAVEPRLGRKWVRHSDSLRWWVWKLEAVGRQRFGIGWAAVRVLGAGAWRW